MLRSLVGSEMCIRDRHNIGSNEEVIVNGCGFDGARRNRYFGDEVISKEEVMGRARKLKNGKSAGIDEITGEMIKNGGEMVIEWIWKLCNKAFMEGIVSNDWRSAIIVPLDKGKGCLLYTSDAADERSSVDLGGRRIIKKKKKPCTSQPQ